MTTGRPFIIILIYLILASSVIAGTLHPVSPGGPDDGLLHLAGATALLQHGDYPIVQRPPLYSAVLALLALVTGTDTTSTQQLAQELGSIDHLDAATVMLDAPFLRAVLILNLLLWSITALMVFLTLHSLAVSRHGIIIAMILMLTPSSWTAVGLVSETPLAACLLALGLYTLSQALTQRPSLANLLLAGTAFALAAMTRAAFQLLSPLLLILLVVMLRWRFSALQLARYGLAFILPFIIIVGTWSARNYAEHGFWGVSGVTGVALSTRTARIVDRAASAYPAEAEVFQRLRDETYLTHPNKDDVVYWGARASNWLMAERGLSYLESNDLLLGYNLAAIRSSPLTYLDTVLSSLIDFHYPGVNDEWPPLPRLLWSAAEFVVMALFLGGVGLWIAAHVLASMGFFAPGWRPVDTVMALGLVVFIYNAFVASAIDTGKPEQRFPVHFLIPLLIVLAMQIGGLKEKRPDKL